MTTVSTTELPTPKNVQPPSLVARAALVAFYAAVVHAYWRPRETLQLLHVTDDVLLAHVLRFVLTVGTYCFAAAYVSWFYYLGATIFLQSACWVLYISQDRYVAMALEALGLGFTLDAATEKHWLELGACVCYAGLAWIIFFGGAAEERHQFRNRLVNFYTKHNPEKLAEVDALVKKYEGNEELLFTRLHRKYNALGAAGGDASIVVPPGKRAVSRDFDESAFLYEEEEELVAFEDDEQAQGDADNEEESGSANDRGGVGGSSGGSDNDEGFEVVKAPRSPLSVRKLSVDTTSAKESDVDPPTTPTHGVAVTSLQSARVRAAIDEARRAQAERVQQRIAQLAARAARQ